MATVTDEVLQAFKQVSKNNNSLEWAVYKFSDDGKEIICEATGTKGETSFDEFKNTLPKKDSRFGSYNVKYELDDGMKKSEIVLIVFTPDGDDLTQAQKGAKIQYSSNLSHLAGKFNPNKNRW